MKNISMKFMSGFISMIMMINLIAPVGVYASVETGDETVIEETAGEETITQEEDLEEQLTTASGAETAKEEEETKEEETVSETGEEEKVSKPFNESKTIGDVTITVKAEAGAFPDGSYLTVKEIASNTDMSSDDETLAASYSYDITIYDKDDNEIEPAEGKNVSVSFSMDKIADSNLDTNIYHTSDDGTVTELDITTSGDTATVATDSFSVYTVEFTYGELTYVMNGDRTIKLSDILSSVGLTGDVSSVECSDTSLFSASDESGEWIISSHKAFSTTEWMKVTIEDVVYEIKVTDTNNIVDHGTCGTNLTWTLDNEWKLTISGTGAMDDYDNFDSDPWYGYENDIKTVVISDGVTSIGEMAFCDCINLTGITIPNSVTNIGDRAFESCESLSSITIPNSVESIGDSAFYHCESLSGITIPSGVTSIGTETFRACRGLTSITIPNGVTSIGEMAFCECFNLRSITIPDSVTSIGAGAFLDCSSLSSITIPSGVTSIADYAFAGCSGLSSITIPSGVTSIGVQAFMECSSLSSITIPASVNSIGDDAFSGINSNAVIYFGGFNWNSLAINAGIPSTVTVPGVATYGDCGKTASDNVTWTLYNDGTLMINGTGDMASRLNYNGSPHWYESRSNIKTVIISDGITSIGKDAFNECSNLSSITIPASVTSIGEDAFKDIKSDAVIHYDGDQTTWNGMIASASLPGTVTVTFTMLACGYCGASGDNVKWKLYNDGTLKISGTGNMANYSTESDVPWYAYIDDITAVTISNGVTSIGDYAFDSCGNLISITIPNGVTSIGREAFNRCKRLRSITIPASVTSIGRAAFCDCQNINSISIPSGVTSINGSTFHSCKSLSSITIPATVTSIGELAFYECFLLENITIPSNVTVIEDYTFYNCTDISSITIPDGVTSIGNGAFYNCQELSSITIPDRVTSIGNSAFEFCDNLSSIIIPASVASIGENAFEDIKSDAVIYYGGTETAWTGMTASAGIPGTATVKFVKAAGTCGKTASDNITWELSHNGTLVISGTGNMANYQDDSDVPWYADISDIRTVTISDGVTSIGDNAFTGCVILSSITIPNGVESIGDNAFKNCTMLGSITIPVSVTSIGEDAFENIDSDAVIYYEGTHEQLYNVTGYDNIPDSQLLCLSDSGNCGADGNNVTWKLYSNGKLEITGTGAMADYSDYSEAPWYDQRYNINSATISDGVTNIGAHAFGDCTKLSSITIPSSVTSIGDYVFENCSSLSGITIPAGVTSIGEGTFQNCTGLSSLSIPNSVTSIGDSAFYNCNSLTSITIPGSVERIGESAFASCIGLTAITIPAGVTSIGNSAFYGCEGLSSVTIPASVTSIGNYAFGNCKGLTDVTIPASVTSIGDSTFIGCISLTDITIPNSVTSIGTDAFTNCTGLTDVTIPASVKSLGDYAFGGCTGLADITIPACVESIGADAFSDIASNAVIHYAGMKSDWDRIAANAGVPSRVTIDCPLAAGTCGASGNNITWALSNTGELVLTGTGAMADYNSESSVPWYAHRLKVKNVTLPDGITNIGAYAFYECGGISSLTIPDSVTSIGTYAFFMCSGISSLTIPNGVTSIGSNAFDSCSGLTSLTIPDSVTSIGAYAFRHCRNLTSITIPNGVTGIGNLTFSDCRALSSLTIPNSVTSIGVGAFFDCEKLSSLTIPASVTSIGNSAFVNMGSNATNPTINFGGTKARWDAFNSNIRVGSNVTVNCTKLNITIKADDQTAALGATVSNDVNKVKITSGSLDTGHTLKGITLDADTSNATTSGTITPKDAVIKSGDTIVTTADNYIITYEAGTLEVTKGNPTVTAPTAKSGLVYDGTDQELLDTLGSTTGGTLKYRVGESGEFTTDKPKAKTAGDHKVYYKVDGGSNYNDVSESFITVNITTRPLTITADSDTKVYDGAALTKDGFSNTALAAGDSIASVTVTGSQTLAGESKNTASNAVIKNSGTDVTSNYSITYKEGTLKVTKKALTITADSDTKVYDGTALTKNSYTNTALAAGDLIASVTVTGSQTVGGSSNNVPGNAVIKNASNADVTASYDINYVNGTLNITKKALTITADSDTKTYDGAALTKNSYTNTALAAGDLIASVTITGSQTVYGESANTPGSAVIKDAAGNNVTASYDITYTNGTLKVDKRDVTVSVSDKTVDYNANEQNGSTVCNFTNLAAGDKATITYTPAKGTDASQTPYDNASFANDFKVMRGSSDVTASYNLTAKTAGKLTINRADIEPRVNLNNWIVGKTPNAPAIAGNVGNGTVTIEYKKSTEDDTAYTDEVPTELGTYTIRVTIAETPNSLGAVVTSEFKIITQPVVEDDDSDKKNDNEEGSSAPEETGYETFMNDLKTAAKKGTAQTLVLNWGTSLSLETMQILKDNPQLTLIFNFKWQGVDYSTTIGGGRTVYVDKNTPWYGPECLIGRYGATRGRVYVNSKTGSTAINQGNGVYVVQRGDSLWKIANRKLHVSVDYLVRRNNIVNRNRIRTGQVIYY